MPEQPGIGRFDVHAHLLPGVDDGCPSVDESLACARLMVDAGYRMAFCTPHIWPGFPENTWPNVRRWTRELQHAVEEAGLPLRLYPGGEINIQATLPAILGWQKEDVPTYGEGGQYVLVDFWCDRLPGEFEAGVRHLKSLGLTVIQAHPERIECFHREPSLVDRLGDMGVLFQGNLQCFTDPPDLPTRQLAEQYLAEGRYFLLGTDCHRLDTLRTRLDGLSAAVRIAGEARVRELTARNPAKLLAAALEPAAR